VAERIVAVDGVELCAEAFGNPADPPILLIMGMGASMLWWEEEFCRLLADGGRFVIRYDHRDTGRSTAYEPGRPGYAGEELTRDAALVLEAHGFATAHVVGVSMGGGIAQELGLEQPERVSSLVLISTTAVAGGRGDLPGVSEDYARFMAAAEVDWSDRASVIDYVVADWRALSGGEREFDEERVRAIATREVERARDFATPQNHELIAGDGAARAGVDSLAAPTLVIHGSADPLFPLEHGVALAEAIPGARLLILDGAGHGIDPDDWDRVAGAILEHTKEGTG
jgi:pimeloyl-ACP methyl ester carboxylesterase